MIKFSDLRNLKHEEKDCIGFDYSFKLENEQEITLSFIKKTEIVWYIRVIMSPSIATVNQIYYFSYQLPTKHMDLALIAAIGARLFQMYIQDEMHLKQEISFHIQEVTKDM